MGQDAQRGTFGRAQEAPVGLQRGEVHVSIGRRPGVGQDTPHWHPTCPLPASPSPFPTIDPPVLDPSARPESGLAAREQDRRREQGDERVLQTVFRVWQAGPSIAGRGASCGRELPDPAVPDQPTIDLGQPPLGPGDPRDAHPHRRARRIRVGTGPHSPPARNPRSSPPPHPVGWRSIRWPPRRGSSAAPAPPPPRTPPGFLVARSWTRVRVRPSPKAELSATLTPGDTVLADSLRQGWYRVALEARLWVRLQVRAGGSHVVLNGVVTRRAHRRAAAARLTAASLRSVSATSAAPYRSARYVAWLARSSRSASSYRPRRPRQVPSSR